MTGPPTPPGGGERRRALDAEREREPAAGQQADQVSPPMSPPMSPAQGPPSATANGQANGRVGPGQPASGRPALVRPYARMSAPTGSVPKVPEDDSAQRGSADAGSTAAKPPQEADDELAAVDAGPAQDRGDDGPPQAPPHLPAPPEMAPPGWSAFTPVIPPGPLPFDAPPAAAQSWNQISVRNDDDEAWLRALRVAAGEEPLGLPSAEGPPLISSAEPIDAPAPSWEDDGFDHEPDDQRQGWTDWADHQPDERHAQLVHVVEPDVEPQPAPLIEPELAPESEPQLEREPIDDVQMQTAPGLSDDPPSPSEPRPSFGQAPADRFSRAVSLGPDAVHDDAAATGQEGVQDSEDDEEPLRGTMAPVLRRSTERARYPTSTTPVVRPPVLPPPPDDLAVPLTTRNQPVSWEEALAGDVLPGKGGRRRGRRAAKARHQSGGHGEYRPRTVDRSLTLLVVGMLLVLILLVGVAAWVFWPRITGLRSLPVHAATGTATARAS